MRNCSVFPARFTKTTSMSPQNSHRICRQDPQGGVSTSVSAATAIRRNLREPSDMALNTATRSAHIVRPYVAFSMLQPVCVNPAASSSAAPTLKSENTAWACSRASNAACRRPSKALPLDLESRQHGLQQAHECLPYLAARLEHFLVIDFLIQNSGRHVCHARDCQHLHSHVTGDDRFRNRRHSHEVGA